MTRPNPYKKQVNLYWTPEFTAFVDAYIEKHPTPPGGTPWNRSAWIAAVIDAFIKSERMLK